ncbi:MAG: hypothetical protein A4E46_00849 [Methanosaeta sp. PtaU1.Bin016]|nr:MAG: hypothetical protein A4E46_00849 [Methanosaeta sp. PtaU1.Bin016]
MQLFSAEAYYPLVRIGHNRTAKPKSSESGFEIMLNDATRVRSGNMPPELQAKVDKLMEEFMTVVDRMVGERHLQRGIARSQLPNSMVAVLDKENLSILAQFRTENRFASYYYNPKIALTPQQAANSARWEFGLEDPVVIQFPSSLLDLDPGERQKTLEKISAHHIDSEFMRLMELLGLMRTRPIFGTGLPELAPMSILLLVPHDENKEKNYNAIKEAVLACNLAAEEADDIREGKTAVREMWLSINRAAIIIADLTGADAGVMYGLGIAHTIGKQTILIYPQGSRYLTDVPRTCRMEYEDSDAGRANLVERLKGTLSSMLQPVG